MMMADATSSNDSPTPGYMLTEISKQTLSSYTACEQIEQYLLSRLAKPNHNIKYKCLLIIKHVCRTGRLEFKRDMSRNVGPIKECLQFRGPPDPLRGDEIYKRVRNLAKETVDAVFDSQMPVVTSAVAAHGRIQGMGGGAPAPQSQNLRSSSPSIIDSAMNRIKEQFEGNDATFVSMGPGGGNDINNGRGGNAYGGGGGVSSNVGGSSPSYGAASSGGFGNPNFEDPRNAPKSALEQAGKMMSSGLAMGMAALNFDPNSGSGGPQGRPGSMGAPGGFVGGGNRQAGGGYNYASNRGPSAANGVYQPGAVNTGLPGGGGRPWPDHMQPRLVPEGEAEAPANSNGSSSGRRFGEGRAGKAAADGSYELSLIDSLCEASGLKAVPAPEKLAQFLIDASTLSVDTVGCCLLEKMNDDAWQARAKALQVVAAMAEKDACRVHKQWWAEDEETVADLRGLALEDPKVKVRSYAVQALQALGRPVEDLLQAAGASGAGAGAGAGRAAASTTTDLLGGFSDARETPTDSSQGNSALADIFGGPASSSSSSSSSGSGGGGGLLDLMSGGGAPVEGLVGMGVIDTTKAGLIAPPGAPANTLASNNSAGGGSLFDGMNVTSSAPAVPVPPDRATNMLLEGISPLTSDTIVAEGTGITLSTSTTTSTMNSNAAVLGGSGHGVGDLETSLSITTASSSPKATQAQSSPSSSGFGFIKASGSGTGAGVSDPLGDLLGGGGNPGGMIPGGIGGGVDLFGGPVPAPGQGMMSAGAAGTSVTMGMMPPSSHQAQDSLMGIGMGMGMGGTPNITMAVGEGAPIGTSTNTGAGAGVGMNAGNMNTMRSFQGMQNPQAIQQRKDQQQQQATQGKKKVTDLLGDGFQM